MKRCPFCAEEVQDAAIKCRYCGEFFGGTSRLLTSSKSGATSAPASESARTPSPPPNSGLATVGFWLAAIGFLLTVYYWLLFDTTVLVPQQTVMGVTVGGDRVHNLGLMQQQQIGVFAGCLMLVAGLVALGLSGQANRRLDLEPAPTPPPTPPLPTWSRPPVDPSPSSVPGNGTHGRRAGGPGPGAGKGEPSLAARSAAFVLLLLVLFVLFQCPGPSSSSQAPGSKTALATAAPSPSPSKDLPFARQREEATRMARALEEQARREKEGRQEEERQAEEERRAREEAARTEREAARAAATARHKLRSHLNRVEGLWKKFEYTVVISADKNPPIELQSWDTNEMRIDLRGFEDRQEPFPGARVASGHLLATLESLQECDRLLSSASASRGIASLAGEYYQSLRDAQSSLAKARQDLDAAKRMLSTPG